MCFLIFFKQGYTQDLLESYQLSLENNPILKQSYFKKMAITETKTQSIAKMLPTVSVSIKTSKERLDNKKVTFQGSGIQNYYSHSLSIDFKQPIFHWNHWVELDISENKIALANAEYLVQEQNLIVKVISAYFNVLLARDHLNFIYTEKKEATRKLERIKKMFEHGMAAMTDVYKSISNLNKVLADEIKAENELNNNKSILVELTGSKNEFKLNTLDKSIDLKKPEPYNILKWQELARKSNLLIIVDLNKLEVSRKTIEIQKSGHYPQLDLTASYEISDENSSFGFRGDRQNIGLQLNIPLFEGGAVNSRTRQAIYEFKASQKKLDETQKNVDRQVKNIFRNILSSLEQVKALEKSIESEEKAMDSVNMGFRVGTQTFVDVLIVQKRLHQVKREHSRNLYEYLINGVKLKQLVSSLNKKDLVKINKLLYK